jgi:MerR family transcriptional regulator, copper efflux regulator
MPEARITLPLLQEPVSAEFLQVGELARRARKTVRAIHLYEEVGLLRPVGRTAGGYRLFGVEALGRVQWIGKLQAMGFSLHRIREFILLNEQASRAPDAMGRVREIFRERLAEVRDHVRELAQLERELEDSLAYLESCQTCDTALVLPACVGCTREGHDGTAPALVAGLHKT